MWWYQFFGRPLPTVFWSDPESEIACTLFLSFLDRFDFLTSPFKSSFCFSIALSKLLFWESDNSIALEALPLVAGWLLLTIFSASCSISFCDNSASVDSWLDWPLDLDLFSSPSFVSPPFLGSSSNSVAGILDSIVLNISMATLREASVDCNLSIFFKSNIDQIFLKLGSASRFLFELVMFI